MVHERKSLAFRLEAGNHLAAVHARFDDLQSDFAPDRLMLLGHVDDTKPAFADLLEKLVAADSSAWPFSGLGASGGRRLGRRICGKAAGIFIDLDQIDDLLPQCCIPAARVLQERLAFGERPLDRADRDFSWIRFVHDEIVRRNTSPFPIHPSPSRFSNISASRSSTSSVKRRFQRSISGDPMSI
jgi:hypothetical protein